MGRIGVTYERVAEVADMIWATGIEPTTIAVRDRVGEGSYTTIGAHLSKWRDKRALLNAPAIQTGVPPEIARSIAAFITNQLDAQKASANAALAAERAAGATSEAEVERLGDELDAAQRQIGQLETQISEASGRIKFAKESRDELDSRLLAAQHRIAEAEKATAVAEARLEAAELRASEASRREDDARAGLKSVRQ